MLLARADEVICNFGFTLLHLLTSAHGTKRRIAATHQIGRYRSKADIGGRSLLRRATSRALGPTDGTIHRPKLMGLRARWDPRGRGPRDFSGSRRTKCSALRKPAD